MEASSGKNNNTRIGQRTIGKSRNNRKQILPALIIVGGACSLLTGPAAALELGELTINSSLGQPLRASIAYALNPHEELYDFCVYLRPTLAANGLPTLSKASISVADGAILLTGSRAIREPLLTMQVSVDCPYTAHIAREYTLMINPPQAVVREVPIVPETTETTEMQPAASPAAAGGSDRPQTARTRSNIDRPPISENSRYRVRRGDSLSDIASRIADRSIPLWPAVEHIFAVNPHAFMDGDMNRLKAGAWLDIPELSAPAATVPGVVATAETKPAIAKAGAPHGGYETPVQNITEQATLPAYEVPETEAQSVPEPGPATFGFTELQPGDVVIGNDSPFVSPIGTPDGETESIDIPDTEIIRPVPVSEMRSNDAGKTSGSWSWFLWLGGSGLAIILGLLMFGHKIRQRFGSMAVRAASEAVPNRRRTDAASRAAEALPDVDFPLADDLPHHSSTTLDADFDDGSGLQDVADMDVAQDFGFSAATAFDDELDLEIPEGAELEPEDNGPTDVIAPPERDEAPLVLDSEILPNEEDDGEYDLSMIVDVTKQDVVESDATEKDLQAVQVATADVMHKEENTLSRETDYRILEQDYEDELTATQALNAEIEKAAAELADRMDINATGEITAQLPGNTEAENDDHGNSGVSEVTARLPGPENDKTVEMPAYDDDVTANMEVESGIIDTKQSKKAS